MTTTTIKWIMIVSGALTLTMLSAVIAPDLVMRQTFGEPADGAAAEIVVRSWGILIGLVGAMLIYGAFHPEVRSLTLTVAIVSKMAYIVLVLLHGRTYLSTAGLSVGFDSVMIVLFTTYMLRARTRAPQTVHSRV
jgi:hypothetical protein